MSKFDPESYRRFRPYYPAELFAPLVPALERRGLSVPYNLVDIGCGTGHSTASLLRALTERGVQARLRGVDPDPAMLEVAREICPQADYFVGSGEANGCPDLSFDAVTIGSAFHWMDATRTREELQRVLRPSGVALIYEYQFPKAATLAELNEWIRREFNLRWRAPAQKPRGDFATVTAVFRNSSQWTVLGDSKVSMIQPLGPEDLTGLLLSQSRVLHYETGMSAETKAQFRKELAEQVSGLMGSVLDRFDFNLQSALFGWNG